MGVETCSKSAAGASAVRHDVHAGSWLRNWRQRASARAMSRELIRSYHEVEQARPELLGVLRYREVVARQTGLDEQEAQQIVDGAEDSFTAWPVVRALIFRDVVQYLVLRHCLQHDAGSQAVYPRLLAIIAEEVPDTY